MVKKKGNSLTAIMLFVLGLLIVIGFYLDANNHPSYAISGSPIWFMVFIGIGLIIAGLILSRIK